MKTLTLKNDYGHKYEISFKLGMYAANDNLYVGMICYEDGFPEPYGDLTVNLETMLDQDKAYIDTNNNGNSIIKWLLDNELGHFTGNYGFSGLCMYPEFEFDMQKLLEHTSRDMRKGW